MVWHETAALRQLQMKRQTAMLTRNQRRQKKKWKQQQTQQKGKIPRNENNAKLIDAVKQLCWVKERVLCHWNAQQN